MHRTLPLKNQKIFEKICELSNISKFKIVELTQDKEMSITILSKEANLAFNKCSNYCSSLENFGLVTKHKEGKEVFVKSNLNLDKLFMLLI
ncbi:winged helix-turn-helix transcriptional regulator [Candidatus Pacearchaeota archaeon]|nr:winged helix-turn-helix transcriptional regulator [Candidatus Pacearchaeota archaeon]